ncbi:MAG: hypothetical protein KZQ77_08115 [Candidatus Thiodiazotropha sp. (ex Notomyrtea botanica)]|nr:hypothetical protein [Candidatus Thiodiazotropha sp. (ex Notomyrtea botanica)]
MFKSIQARQNPITGLMAILLITGFCACSKEPESTDSTKSQGTANRTAQSQPAAQRDLSTFDVCAQVPTVDVAGVLGAAPSRISADATMQSYASDCTYTIMRDDGSKGYAMVWLYSPNMWDPTAAGEIEKISGLGDDAYLEKNSSGAFNRILILVEGNFMLDSRAGSREQARGLAELALKRLTGNSG